VDTQSVDELLDRGGDALPRRPGIPEPRREALWLLAAAWGRDTTWVRLHRETTVPGEVVRRYEDWLERRAAGVPAHHLTGVCPFWGRPFRVSPEVLIPRPETELLVERALALELPPRARVVDVGTGSGCLAVTLALERPGWRVAATDRSAAALWMARRNARALGAGARLVLTDLVAGLTGPVHLVAANLPYVPAQAMAELPVEVRHDPRGALDGGPDGLALVRRLLAGLPRLLSPAGVALLELGEGQAEAVAREAAPWGLKVAARIKDLGGCERIVELRPRTGRRESS